VLSSGAETFPADAAKKKEDKTKATETKKSSQPLLTWKLQQVLPTKFKGPDLSSTASQVAIEELHLVHEGLELVRAPEPKAAADTPPAGGAR
jgi:phage tail-like protein